MADYADIADAIAARFLGMTPPTGQPTIKVATADIPEGIGQTPAFLVGQPDDEWQAAMALRRGTLRFPCHLVFDQSDAARTARAAMAWRTLLYQRLDGQVHLGGVAGVASARVASTSVGKLTLGDAEWQAIELTVVVEIAEAHNAVA